MRSLTTRLVVDPLLRSSPVHDWLSEQLEQCGIDGHYASRCVLSIATRECTDDEPKISSCFDVQPGGDFDVVRKSPVSPLAGGGGAQDSVEWNRKQWSCEERKKLQIMEWLRLMLSTEEWRTHQLTVKQLVSELFHKLHQQHQPTQDGESSETSPVSETAPDAGSDSPQDVAARYYAAFPSLSDKCDLLANRSLLPFDAEWSRVAQTQPKLQKMPDTGITDSDNSGGSSSVPLVGNTGSGGGCRRHSCTKPSGFVPPARRSSQKSSRLDASRRSRPSRSSRSHRSSYRSEHNRWPATAPFIYLPVSWMNVAPGGFSDPTWCTQYTVTSTDDPATAADENEIPENDDENSPSSYKDRFVNLKSCFWGKPSFEDTESALGNKNFSDERYRKALVPCIVSSETSTAEPQNERSPLSTLFGMRRAFDHPPLPSAASGLETRTAEQQSLNTLGNFPLSASDVSSSAAAVVSVGNEQFSGVDTLWSTLASSFDDDDDDDPLLGCRPLDPELWFVLNSERMNIAGVLSSDTPFHFDFPLDDYCFPPRAMHALPCFGNLRQLEWNVLDDVEAADLCENILSSGALPPWLMSLTDDLQNEHSSFCTENSGICVKHTGFVSPVCAMGNTAQTSAHDCGVTRRSPESCCEDRGEIWDGCLIAEAVHGSSGQESVSLDPDAIRRIWKPKKDDPIPETGCDEDKFRLPAVGPWTQCPEPWSTWSSGGITAMNSSGRAPASDSRASAGQDISEMNGGYGSCSISQNNSNSNITSLVRRESISDDRHFTSRVIYKDDAAQECDVYPDECLNEFCENSFAGESPLPFSFCSSADIDLLIGESLNFKCGFESASGEDCSSYVECLKLVDASGESIPKVDQQNYLKCPDEEDGGSHAGWPSRLFPADAVATIGELPCGDGEHCCSGTVSNLTLDNVRQLFACSSAKSVAAAATMKPTCSMRMECMNNFAVSSPPGFCEENNNLLYAGNSSACCTAAAEFTAAKSSGGLHIDTNASPDLLPDLPSISDICFSDTSSDVGSTCTFSSGSGGSVFCSPEPCDFLSSSAVASSEAAMTDPAIVDFSLQGGIPVPSMPIFPVNSCAFEPHQVVGHLSAGATSSIAAPFYSIVGSNSSMWFRDTQFVMSSFDALSRIAPQQIHTRPFFGAWPSPSRLSHQSVCSAIARCGRLFPSENSAFRDNIPQRISSDTSSLLHTIVCCSTSDSFFPRWLPPAAAQPLEVKITPTHQFRPIGTPSLSDTDSDCCSSVSCASPCVPNNSEIISNIVTSVSFSREAVGVTHFDSDAVYQQFIGDGNAADEEVDIGTVGIRSFRPSFKVRCELEKSAQTGDASPELRQMSDGDAEMSTSRLVTQVLRQLSNEFPAPIVATGSTPDLPSTFTTDSLPDSAFAELLTSKDDSVASLSRRLSRIWNQTSEDNSWSSDSRGVTTGSDKDVVLGHLADIWSNDPPVTLTGSVVVSCPVIDGLPSSVRISEIWKDEPDLVVNDLQPTSPDIWEDASGKCDQCDGDKDDMVSSSCSLLHVWSSVHDFCACETGELVPSHLAEIWSDVRQPPDGEESVERPGETDEAHVISRIWSQTSLDHKTRGSPSAVEAEKSSDVDSSLLDECQQLANVENISSSAGLPQVQSGRPEPTGSVLLPQDLSSRIVDGGRDTTDAVESAKKFIGGIGGSLFGSNRVWSLDGPEPESDEGKEPDARLKAIWDKPICSEPPAMRSSQDGTDDVEADTVPGSCATSTCDPVYVAAAVAESSDETESAAGTETEVSTSCEVDLMLNLVSGILEMMSQSCTVTGCNSVITKSISEPASSTSAAAVLGWPATFMRRGSLETFLPIESTANCLHGQLTDIAAHPMSFPQCFSAEWPMTYSKGGGGFHAMRASELPQSVGQRADTLSTAGHATMPTGRWSLSSQRDYSELLEALSCEQLQARNTLGGALYAFMSPGLGGGSSDAADVGILAVASSTGGSLSSQSGSSPVIVPRRLETVHKTTTMTPINLWS